MTIWILEWHQSRHLVSYVKRSDLILLDEKIKI